MLVTNQLQFTKEADLIVYLADGKVEERGTYAELMAADAGYAKLMNQAEVRHAWSLRALRGAETCGRGPHVCADLACCFILACIDRHALALLAFSGSCGQDLRTIGECRPHIN